MHCSPEVQVNNVNNASNVSSEPTTKCLTGARYAVYLMQRNTIHDQLVTISHLIITSKVTGAV